MKFNSTTGMSFELKILGYEFPTIKNDRWDSNWLEVAIDVTHPDGCWSATHPCLLTSELQKLANWLERLDKGQKVDEAVDFIEPNLEFQIIEKDGQTQFLRVCFQVEFKPQWFEPNYASGCDLWVEFSLEEIDLEAAVKTLRKMLEDFPPRGL